jgi:hypothetical protein
MQTAKSLAFSNWFNLSATAAARVVLPDPGIPEMPMRVRLLGSLLWLSARVILADVQPE